MATVQVQLCEWRQFLEFLDKRARVFELNGIISGGVCEDWLLEPHKKWGRIHQLPVHIIEDFWAGCNSETIDSLNFTEVLTTNIQASNSSCRKVLVILDE